MVYSTSRYRRSVKFGIPICMPNGSGKYPKNGLKHLNTAQINEVLMDVRTRQSGIRCIHFFLINGKVQIKLLGRGNYSWTGIGEREKGIGRRESGNEKVFIFPVTGKKGDRK